MSTYVIEFLSFWHEYFRGSQHVIDGKGVKWHVIEIKRLSLILASGTFLRRRVVKHEPPELYRKIQAPVWFRLRRVRKRLYQLAGYHHSSRPHSYLRELRDLSHSCGNEACNGRLF